MLGMFLDEFFQFGGEMGILQTEAFDLLDVGIGDDGVLLDQLLVVDHGCVVDGDIAYFWFGLFNLL